MKRTTIVIGVLAAFAIAVFATAPARAQDSYGAAVSKMINGDWVLKGNGAISTEPAIVIRYIGLTPGGTVTVAAGGAVTLSTGPVGASAVDTTVECPRAAPYAGVFDVTNAACDTLGELVDAINFSANWRAAIVNGLRLDSSNDTLAVLAETAANGVDGLGLLYDGAVGFNSSLVIAHPDVRKIGFYTQGPANSTVLKTNPFAGLKPILFEMNGTSTYGAGTSAMEIHCLAITQAVGGNAGTEVDTVYAAPSAATTVNIRYAYGLGMGCPVGQKMLVRIHNSAAMTAAILYAAGVVIKP